MLKALAWDQTFKFPITMSHNHKGEVWDILPSHTTWQISYFFSARCRYKT